MRKILFFATVAGIISACDYSVKSNGNIDEAYAHEPKVEVESMHEAAHHAEPVAAPIHTDTTIIVDSAATDTTKHVEEAHH
jgi:hypothetical protein